MISFTPASEVYMAYKLQMPGYYPKERIQNGLLAFQPSDMAASQRILYWNQIYKKILYQPGKNFSHKVHAHMYKTDCPL